ncbi:tetratricopeptide repeat protein [Desmospora profundinema]|uniref:Tetratricopeptide (TPR) repeat protein n=1 Tax=Desmospora profundinema TaxID=1571184 RepID=A0ABU1IQP9_9BACL|nr:tetratricopeptide repeat protein [Desmospora profundinema]MDR6227031.1 tetratricopeptide (TPR) repeat protein [Desmospora profundinema]
MNTMKPGDWIRNTYRVLHSFPFVQGVLHYAEIPKQTDAVTHDEEPIPTRFLHGMDLRHIQRGAQLGELLKRDRQAFVPLQGLFVEKGTLFQVYGKMDGTLMAHHLYQAVPLSLGETLDLLRAIAGHWVQLEEQGQFAVIHPQNMLISADTVRFLYGGAHGLLPKWNGNNPSPEKNPEMRRKQEHSLDAYSLGALTYIMLTGTSPQPGSGLEPVRSFRSDVPEGLEYFVMHSLQAKPEERPTIGQLWNWLEQIPVEADRQKKKDDLIYYMTPGWAGFKEDWFSRGVTQAQAAPPAGGLDPEQWEGWQAGEVDDGSAGRSPSHSRMANGAEEVLNPVWHKDSVKQAPLESGSLEAEGTPSETEKKHSRPVIFKQREKSSPRPQWLVWAATGAAVLLLLAGGGWAVTSYLGDDNSIAEGASPEEKAAKAAQHYEESVRAYKEGEMDRAIQLGKQSVELNPEEKGYLLHLANIYGEQKQYDQGVRLLKNGVKQIPDADVYDALVVHAYYAEDWEEAERAIGRALSLEPKHPEYLYHQGKIQGAMGDYTAATRSIQFAIDQDRNNALYHHDRAIFLLKDKDLERAKNYAWRAAKLEPENARYWITTGNIYLADRERVKKDKSLSSKERRFEGLTLARHAINFYSEAVEINPKNARAHYRLSIAHYYNEDYDAARQSAEQAVKREPGRALHHYQLGVVLAKQGELEQAENSLKKAREIDPDNGRYQEALDELG